MDSKALQETRGHLEPQDCRGLQVNLVIEDLRVLQVVKETLGLLGHKEQLEAQGQQAQLVSQDQMDSQDLLDLLAPWVQQDQLGKKEIRGSKVHLVPQGQLDQWALREMQGLLEVLDSKDPVVSLVIQELLGQQEILETLDLLGPQDHRAHKVLQDSLACQETKVLLAQWGLLVHKDLLVRVREEI